MEPSERRAIAPLFPGTDKIPACACGRGVAAWGVAAGGAQLVQILALTKEDDPTCKQQTTALRVKKISYEHRPPYEQHIRQDAYQDPNLDPDPDLDPDVGPNPDRDLDVDPDLDLDPDMDLDLFPDLPLHPDVDLDPYLDPNPGPDLSPDLHCYQWWCLCCYCRSYLFLLLTLS